MDMFEALADPTRRNIIELLADSGQMPASGIYNHFKVSHPAISQHLKILREARLVDMEKRAQQRLYTINSVSMRQLEGWIKRMNAMWGEKFDALDKLLVEEKKKGGV